MRAPCSARQQRRGQSGRAATGCGKSAAPSSSPRRGALGVVAMLCLVQTAQAFAVTPPPKAVGWQDVVPIKSRVMPAQRPATFPTAPLLLPPPSPQPASPPRPPPPLAKSSAATPSPSLASTLGARVDGAAANEPPPHRPPRVPAKDLVPLGWHTARRLTVTLVEPGAGTLQAAVDAASAGDELVLKDGTYTGSGDNVLHIAKDITIRAQNAGMAVLDGEDARRVVYITGGTVVLEGLAITKGHSVSALLVHSLNVHPSPRWMKLP